MSDHSHIPCNNDREMEYILEKYGKHRTSENVEQLRNICREFKNDSEYAPPTRDSFYKYLKDKDVLHTLK